MKFIDFCSGIGGGRLGLEKAGFTCIAFSEIDKAAIKTYKRLFDVKNEVELGDLTQIKPEFLPDFDLLISGFPCQSFSIVGKREGLNNKEKGQIIFYLADILRIKQPNFFILENVKGLLNHDKGRTFKKILQLLKSLDYKVSAKLLNSVDFSLAQSRERVYFVGVKKSLNKSFKFDLNTQKKRILKDFLCPCDENILNKDKHETFLRYLQNKYNQNRFCLKELLKNDFLVLDTRQSDLRLYKDKIPTLRRDRQGILYVYDKKLYALSKIEALRLQGFGKLDDLENKVRDLKQSDILRQCGNAMSVNVIESVAKSLKEQING